MLNLIKSMKIGRKEENTTILVNFFSEMNKKMEETKI
jgi:hypothetical protein